MSKDKLDFPVFINSWKEREFLRFAKLFVQDFEHFVYPVLYRFGLLDDEHVQKYFSSSTMEDIYKDALLMDANRISYIEKEALFSDVDVWADIRDKTSPVLSPSEEGFVFAQIPRSDYIHKKTIIKALSVKRGKISIDEDILQKACIRKPTNEQQEFYEFISEFCKEFNERNKRKSLVTAFVCYDRKNNLIPCPEGILEGVFNSIK